MFAFCFLIERIIPGWKLPEVPTWTIRVISINFVQLGIVTIAGYTWEKWFSSISIFDLSNYVNSIGGGFIAYFIATFIFYWWHRWRHKIDYLWTHFHQIHHSPQRLEVITSFYKHPLEMTVNSIVGSLLVFTLLGLSMEAGAVYTLFTALGEFFYHTNIKTPQWIGYIFQRPEMHRIHHQAGTEHLNYSDIPLWDMLFGTFHNPAIFNGKCGFAAGLEARLGEMLQFRDLHK